MRCSLVYSKPSELHFPCLKPCWVPPLPELCSAWSANRSTNGRKEQRRRTMGFHWYQPSYGSYSTTNVKCKTFAFYKKILHLDFYHFSMIDFTSPLMLFRIGFFLGSMIAWSCLSVLLCCGDLSRVNSIISPMKRVLSWCFQSWILFAFLWCQYWCRFRFTSSGNSTVGNSLSGLQYRPFANRCHQGTPLLRDKNKRHGFLRWTSRGWGRNPRPR